MLPLQLCRDQHVDERPHERLGIRLLELIEGSWLREQDLSL